MANAKEVLSSSSDSEEEIAPPQKKSKATQKVQDAGDSKGGKSKKQAQSSKEKGGSDGAMFLLSKMKYATVSQFKGQVLVGIRQYYEAEDGLRPGNKGISLTLDQWKKLKDTVADIDEAIKQV